MEHLDEATVAALLDDPSELTDTIERVLGELSRGEAASTQRVRADAGGSMASAMAAVVPSLGVSGGKVYSTAQGRFTFHVVLFDIDGRVLCSMDGGALTAARTPALCAVAIRHLAPVGAVTTAVLGTGREALPHIEMLQRELAPAEIRVWGRAPDRAEVVAAEATSAGAPAIVVSSADEAVSGADVVVTVTSADDPLFDPATLADTALVCAVGATKPQRCELHPAVFSRAAAIVADSAEGSRVECGDLIRAARAGTFTWDRLVDLSEMLAGQADVPRAGSVGPVVFESQGLAILDVVAAAQAWSRHRSSR